MIMVRNGLFILGPAGIVLGIVSRDWIVASGGAFIMLMSAGLWYSEKRTQWITRPRRR